MIYRKIKNLMYKHRTSHFYEKRLKPQQTIRMGSNHGGFEIVPQKLEGQHIIVYSFGIGEDLLFSNDILNRFDADIFAYDPTPKAIEYVHSNELSNNKRFHFFSYGLSDKEGKAMFYLPQNDKWVSGSSVITKDKRKTGLEVDMVDLISLMIMNGHNHIDLLKMDIEGSEFSVIRALANMVSQGSDIPTVSQICVEVHDRFIENGFEILEEFFENMTVLGYKLVHVSDTCEELTFLRKDRSDS